MSVSLRRSRAVGAGAPALFASWIFTVCRPADAQPRLPCAAVGEHARDTVVVFQPPSGLTICRKGQRESDVVTGRPVYLLVAPTPGTHMFDFRVHGQAAEWSPTGLSAWEDRAHRLAGRLHDLGLSSQSISTIGVAPDPVPATAASLRALSAARARYLGVVTARYDEALQATLAEMGELPVLSSVVRRWCAELHGDAPASAAVAAELQARCAGVELREGAVEQQVHGVDAAGRAFEERRLRARDATLTATSHPEDAAAATDAVRALDEARDAAAAVLSAASPLERSSRELAHDVATLRTAIRSIDALRPGRATYLSTYEAPGNAELEIDASPVDIGAISPAAEQKAAGKTTLRFPVVGRHYLDIEAGVGFTAGLPSIPSVATQSNAAVIRGQPVDEFVGLALFELEPARFVWPDRPASGLLRLPVIGVPFTRDPTQNFFIGAGLGWTGVGSITAGPYLLRELTLRSGYDVGQTLPAGTSLDAVTNAALQVGYFVSASVDLLGVVHLFLPPHASVIDAASGREK